MKMNKSQNKENLAKQCKMVGVEYEAQEVKSSSKVHFSKTTSARGQHSSLS